MTRLITLLFFLVFVSNGHAQSSLGVVTKNNYKCKEIGWSFSIPIGWKVREDKEIHRVRNLGKAVVGDHFNSNIQMEALKPLLYIAADQFHRFTSDLEEYDESRDGNYEESDEEASKAAISALESKGLKIKSTLTKESIDGVKFTVLAIDAYDPTGNQKLFVTKFYSALLRSRWSLALSYTAKTSESAKSIEKAILASKFEN